MNRLQSLITGSLAINTLGLAPRHHPDRQSALHNTALQNTIANNGYALFETEHSTGNGKMLWDQLYQFAHSRPMELDLNKSMVLTPPKTPFPPLPDDIEAHVKWIETSFPAEPDHFYHHILKLVADGNRQGQADVWHQDTIAYLTFCQTFWGEGTEIAPYARNPSDLGHRIDQAPTGKTIVFPGGYGAGMFGQAQGIHRSPSQFSDRLVLISYLEDIKNFSLC